MVDIFQCCYKQSEKNKITISLLHTLGYYALTYYMLILYSLLGTQFLPQRAIRLTEGVNGQFCESGEFCRRGNVQD